MHAMSHVPALSDDPGVPPKGGLTLRAQALRVLRATTLQEKLAPSVGRPMDEESGDPLRVDAPGRPPGLEIVPHAHARIPAAVGMHDPAQRVRILHALANHELQAAELFAWCLLAFPRAPWTFRYGCWRIAEEEQRHCRMYVRRLEALGASFGQWPVSGHFWNKVPHIRTPLQFVCTMGLTFENANLDFCQEHIDAAGAAGDEVTAKILEQVHQDEVRHVSFAWRWLARWKRSDESMWEAYCRSVAPPHGPHRARGKTFDLEARLAAGMDPDFVEALRQTRPTRPGGAPR